MVIVIILRDVELAGLGGRPLLFILIPALLGSQHQGVRSVPHPHHPSNPGYESMQVDSQEAKRMVKSFLEDLLT